MIYRGINWDDFNSRVAANFTVGEVSRRDARRIVTDPRVADRIINTARELQKARDFFGRPIIITSWYRPIDINRAIGSDDTSEHVRGTAVDFAVSGVSFEKMLAIFRANWSGRLFSYQRREFLHIDRRGGGEWRAGASPSFYQELE